MLNLCISCLTMSNLLWYTDLTSQVPMQYCSLQHWTLFSPPDTSTTKRCFRFGSAASLFLEPLVIVLCAYLVAHWIPSNLGAHLPGPSFCLFILSMGFSWQEYGNVLPLPPSVDPENSLLRPFRTLQCDPSILGGPKQHGSASMSYASHFITRMWFMKRNFLHTLNKHLHFI